MTRILMVRITLAFIGLGVWGYGKAADVPNLRLVAMAILSIALLLRFAPRRWFDERAP